MKRYILASIYLLLSLCLILHSQCIAQVQLGAEQMEVLLPQLQGKRVAIMANQTTIIGANKTHLVDSLLSLGVDIRKIFVPEHGFRGTIDAGKNVKNGRDKKTGLPIISLYRKNKRPSKQELADVDVVIFDLQDVGTRFYTYISSMHYIMEGVAEAHKQLIICDRPNPNDFVAGPIRKDDCKSFISQHAIPILHGLTVGELALMINGEGWLRHHNKCNVEIITVKGWQHQKPYKLPIAPSPNLREPQAIRLYPTLCLFEASILSVGRGTDKPFMVLGYPNKAFGSYLFKPKSIQGQALNPKLMNKICYGVDYSSPEFKFKEAFTLEPLIRYYAIAKKNRLELIDRRRTFELLIGNKNILPMIKQGLSYEEIKQTWLKDLEAYKLMRQKYLLYPEKQEENDDTRLTH